jgi:hypothetical protein
MILAFIGVTSVDFFVADGLAEIDRGKRDREQYLRPIREAQSRTPFWQLRKLVERWHYRLCPRPRSFVLVG